MSKYLLSVKQDLDERFEEIDSYVNFLGSLEKLEDKDAVAYKKIIPATSNVYKILKANTYILLYNLIEWFTVEISECICRYISDDEVKYKDVIDEIKSLELKWNRINKINGNSISLKDLISSINNDIINLSTKISKQGDKRDFKDQLNCNGNLTKKTTLNILKDFGLILSEDGNLSHSDSCIIKEHRNKLAHGEKRFQEIGQTITIQEIQKITNDVRDYVHFLYENIETYLNNKGYKIKYPLYRKILAIFHY